MNKEKIWSSCGNDKIYEFYRGSERSKDLRSWVSKAYSELENYLDDNFISSFRDNDFYSRLWELELAEFLHINWPKQLCPSQKNRPDFCIELKDGKKIWIEAALPKPDQSIKHGVGDCSESDFPSKQIALRYTSVLHDKAKKYERYIENNRVSTKDYNLIATSGIQLRGIYSDMPEFMRAILPIEGQLVYFSTDGKPLDQNVPRPTHTINASYSKDSGSLVSKEFIYPGDAFPFIDGVIFSEASNLQQLLGTYSTSFSDSTNIPHIFPNYSGKKLPSLFTKYFYSHEYQKNKIMTELKEKPPVKTKTEYA